MPTTMSASAARGSMLRAATLRGTTLVELIVVLAILGLMAGMSALALRSLEMPRASERVRVLEQARSTAIRTGKPVAVAADSVVPAAVLFLPDGRAIGAGVDPLTGVVAIEGPADVRR